MYSRTITIRRRDLPHWHTNEGTYFVTFRLFDSLPADLARLRGGKRVEEALDRGFGSALLVKPEIGDLVYNAIQHFHGQRYTLHTACVMPNHVHAVFRTAPAVSLSDVTHSWKSYTAREANRRSGRRSRSIDSRANEYVLTNPEKAGLRDWKWVRQAGGLHHIDSS